MKKLILPLILAASVSGCAQNQYSLKPGDAARISTDRHIQAVIDATYEAYGDDEELEFFNIYSIRSIRAPNDLSWQICSLFRGSEWAQGEYKQTHLHRGVATITDTNVLTGVCDLARYPSRPSNFTFMSGEHLENKQQDVASAASSNSSGVKTGSECNDEYGILEGSLAVEDVSDYLNCIERAKNTYGSIASEYEPIEPGSSVMVDVSHMYHPGEMKLSNGNLLRGVEWEALKQVLPANQSNRDVVIDAFSRYWFAYDKFDQRIRVEPLRYISGPYSQTSYVSLRGSLADGGAPNLRLEFKFYGSDWLFADSVRVHADGYNWNSGPINFTRDHTDKVWEIASIPLSGQGMDIARRIANGDDVTIRFVGNDYYHDFDVPSVMKEDIGAMLKAIESM